MVETIDIPRVETVDETQAICPNCEQTYRTVVPVTLGSIEAHSSTEQVAPNGQYVTTVICEHCASHLGFPTQHDLAVPVDEFYHTNQYVLPKQLEQRQDAFNSLVAVALVVALVAGLYIAGVLPHEGIGGDSALWTVGIVTAFLLFTRYMVHKTAGVDK